MVTFLITLVVTVLMPITSADVKGNNTVVSYCEIGKEYFSKNECKPCRKCPKAPDFQSYRIKVSPTYGALECYPCFCKPEKKVFDPDTGRCKRCNECKHNGKLNKTVAIPKDRYKGGLNCYECQCNQNHFMNYRTHYQCVKCQNCSMMNREYDRQCSQEEDAKCGKCIEGFKEPRFSGVCEIRTNETVQTTTIESKKPTSTQWVTPVTIKERTSLNHGYKSQIILVVVLVITSVTALGIIFVVYRIIQRPCCLVSNDLLSASTSATTMSTSTMDNQKQNKPTEHEELVQSMPLLSDLQTDGTTDGKDKGDKQPTQSLTTSNNRTIYVLHQTGDNCKVVFHPSADKIPS